MTQFINKTGYDLIIKTDDNVIYEVKNNDEIITSCKIKKVKYPFLGWRKF